MRRTSAVILSFFVVGCATTQEADPNYIAYITAAQAMHAQAMLNKKPMVELTGNGQPITGIASLRVYAPDSAGGGVHIQPFVRQPNEWAQVGAAALNVVGVLGGAYIGAWGAKALVGAIGSVTTPAFNAMNNTTVAGYNAMNGIVSNTIPPLATVITELGTRPTTVIPPSPNVTITNSGQQVINGGTAYGPQAGNSGRIESPDQIPTWNNSYNPVTPN